MNLESLKLPNDAKFDYEDLDFSNGVIMIKFVQRAIERVTQAQKLVNNAVDRETLKKLQE